MKSARAESIAGDMQRKLSARGRAWTLTEKYFFAEHGYLSCSWKHDRELVRLYVEIKDDVRSAQQRLARALEPASDGTLANRVEGMSEEAYLRKGSGSGCQLHMQVEEYFIDIVGPSEPIVRQFAQDALGSLPKQ